MKVARRTTLSPSRSRPLYPVVHRVGRSETARSRAFPFGSFALVDLPTRLARSHQARHVGIQQRAAQGHAVYRSGDVLHPRLVHHNSRSRTSVGALTAPTMAS